MNDACETFFKSSTLKNVYHSQCIILGMSFTVCYILYCMFYYQEYYNITSPTINYLNIILSRSL